MDNRVKPGNPWYNRDMDKNKLESLRDRYLEQERDLETVISDFYFDGGSSSRTHAELQRLEIKLELLNDLISLFE